MKYLVTVFTCLFLLNFSALSQNGRIDSLKTVILDLKEDTLKVNTLLSLSRAFSSMSLDSSKVYAIEAQNLSKKIEFAKGLGDAYRSLAFIYSNKANYDSTVIYIQRAKPIYAELNDKKRSAKLLNLEANALEKNGDYTGSQKIYYEALKISEENNLYVEQIDILNSIAVQAMGQHDVPGSIKTLERSLKIAEENGFSNKIVRACINLSVAHDSLEIRQSYLKRAIEISEPLKLNRELGYAYSSKAAVELYLENYDAAIALYHKSIGLAKRTGDKLKEIRLSKAIADAFLQASRPDSAEYYYRNFLSNTDYKDYKSNKFLVYKSLSEALANKSKYQEAYDTLVRAYDESRQVYKDNIADNLAEADAKYETEKKDAELAKQELEIEKSMNQRKQLIGIAIGLLILLSGIYLWYYERQKRKKKEAELALLEKQKETEKLKELDEMKTAFFTNVSHELKTPLTLILGPLSEVKEKVDKIDVKKSIHMAHSNAERLLEMVNEVMELSKLESGNVQLKNKEIAIKPFLNRVVFAFESMAEMRNIKLLINENIGNKVLNIDENKLEKILNNLISNAVKFSPNESQVTVDAEILDNKLIVSVSDQGKGIHHDEIDKIFNRFYQSNIVTAVEGGGTGVGLALSRELAELFGGTLEVRSDLGNGSTFKLEIPVEITSKISEEVRNIELKEKDSITYQPILINGEKPHILIIEDNQDMREYLGSILESEYRVSYAADGFKALQALQKNSFDVISSDIMMPQMDGLALKEKVNQLEGLKRIPFIFLSARSLEEDKLEGLRLGVDDYITKPFNKYEFKARIYNLLQNKKERDSWINQNSEESTEITNLDEELLKQAENSILKNMENPNYKVNDLASDLNYSQRQLTRLLKKLTGMTPVNFILEMRMQKAYSLLNYGKYATINEVRYRVGIESASYFTRKFKDRFGINPGEMIE